MILLDWIADKIGLPHNEDVDQINFAKWLSDTREAKSATKPLVWNEYHSEGELRELDAETPFGTFYRIQFGVEGVYVEHDYNPTIGCFEGLKAAMTAAQQDYEKRMRDAYGE